MRLLLNVTTPTRIFLVMELCNGGSLEELLHDNATGTDRPLGEDIIRHFFSQMGKLILNNAHLIVMDKGRSAAASTLAARGVWLGNVQT